ncbi:hypothetical protein GCM10008908_01320 [Clostridium subterminale]|uniref:Uncharacterized protein n=1 Tax=Clostridium subterminale TaxID=1550 RepID=A0ABP3VT60_CLOSU
MRLPLGPVYIIDANNSTIIIRKASIASTLLIIKDSTKPITPITQVIKHVFLILDNAILGLYFSFSSLLRK